MKTNIALRTVARLLRLPIDPPPPPHSLGVRDGVLAPCRRSPNCVSSRGTDPRHVIPPLQDLGGRDRTLERIRDVISALPGAKIIVEEPGYLHATFTTRAWRFVDDFEVLWSEEERCLHVRSASRVGRRDYGVNRRRVELIRALLGP